jgi:hypothetical protein
VIIMQPTGTHLAQLNVGRLIAETDDPRVAEFMAALDSVNGLGKRMPGFVWMMEGSGGPNTGNTDTKIDGDPRFVANLTVWENVVMWWVPAGHKPTLEEALARLEYLKTHGDSDQAFGWSYLKDAKLWRSRGCVVEAAE